MAGKLRNLVPVDGEERLWERVVGETDKQWLAFRTYRDVPAVDRTVKEAYRRSAGKPDAPAAPTWWYDTSTRNRWRERAHAFDQWSERRLVDEETSERLRSRRARRAVLTGALRKLANNLDSVDVTKASVGEFTKLLEVVVRQLRDEYDETPTQRLKVAGLADETGEVVPIVITASQAKV